MHDPYRNTPSPDDLQPTVDYRASGALPQHVGRYRVQRMLGEGGFGVVYLAHDDQLQRPVAIKVAHARLIERPSDAEAYLTEARTVASLDHPNILPVYDVGSADEYPVFVVSKYIDGSDLFTWLRRSRLSWIEAAELVATVAEALHYAHKQAIVHRDIKTNNILLDKTGKPFVADFGLALRERDIGNGPRYAGTPAYMSPEQARGEGHRVDGRSDIFSLAVVFYELLTGRRPFCGDTTVEVLRQVTTFEPRPPRQVDDRIPKELERICLKALSKRATDRYSTACDMADDLRHWMAGSVADESAAEASESVAKPLASPGLVAVVHADGQNTPPRSPTTSPVTPSDSRPCRIVPKGLRSFDARDADFFLDLLPGPRDRDGLPDSIRFWKTRIEDTDGDNTFAVGLIYGPSGCGKSSLVKAGLLPRLSPSITAAYIEATSDDTEARLLKALRRQLPDLPSSLGFVESLAALRQGRFLAPRQKVLLVLDQFEQWLHAKHHEEDCELLQALRQCAGGRLQAVVMVRDDFWLAVSRFMQALEIILDGENSRLVDLFDPRHARKLLTAFGRALGALPEKEVTQDQNAFLDQAVAGLVHDGKIISVRLALFAEMVKGKPWTPATLKELGGTKGVGVTFLEETFTASTAPPQHRLHQKAAQAVLNALLPQAETDIKGHMRSQHDLFAASGYENRQKDFAEVIRILDGELRLITPTDPEGKDEADTSTMEAGTKYYQLTHDYLVPSLHDWLTRKQKETRRGRAELLLAEQAAAFAAKPDARHLPDWFEWPRILLFTRRRNWTSSERRLMRAAGRRRGAQAALALLFLLAMAFTGREARRRVNDDRNRMQGDEVVKRLLVAPLTATPGIAAEIASYRAWTDAKLRRVLAPDSTSRAAEKLRASIGLLDVDSAQAEAIYDAMLRASPDETVVLIAVLKPHCAGFTERLRRLLEDGTAPTGPRLRAALALADYAPPAAADAFWLSQAATLVDQMLAEARQDPGRYEPLVAALEPAKKVLLPALEVVFRDEERNATERELATSMLGKYAADDPGLLVRLIEDAQPEQFLKLFPLLETHRGAARGPLADRVGEAPVGDIPQAERVTLGRRRAIAAVALLRHGEIDATLNALRVTGDPESLTQFVHGARARGVSPNELLLCLDRVDTTRQTVSGEARKLEDRVLFGLLLALGDFTLEDIPQSQRENILPRLAEWHVHDASSAIHGATGWLLRHWGQGDLAKQVDETPTAYSPNREWFTLKFEPQPQQPEAPARHDSESSGDGLGRPSSNTGAPAAQIENPESRMQNPFCITFIVFPPGKYLLGSPDGEADRQTDERRHQVEITRPFAISDREITWAQFSPFDGAGWHDAMETLYDRELALAEPSFGVDWFQAVSYCRWLTSQVGVAESEQPYADPSSLEKDGEGNPKNWPLDIAKYGFRLPTEAEWEIACRGGTLSAWSFGSDVDLLAHYAWFVDSAWFVESPGQLRPNPRGLFDLHGNVYEWCHDWYGSSYADDAMDSLGALRGDERVNRGGGWLTHAAYCRTAYRDSSRPTHNANDQGFRLALSIVQSGE